uniref:PLD phosphodiesterase domain-containing protein n=1 Tax=Sexangularia sp. CB-2014 TaxID=1486929 RepID=A0A7S1YIU3_9EUKA|mmetsp:Transcript_5351/g.17248  ORF Transcript_5351/g.17248 Transcript_5351/m.17248 type:complete len:562 (+) Transcript_5351:46-1731(+)
MSRPLFDRPFLSGSIVHTTKRRPSTGTVRPSNVYTPVTMVPPEPIRFLFISSFVVDIRFVVDLLLHKATFCGDAGGQGHRLGGSKRKAIVLDSSDEEADEVSAGEATAAPPVPSWPDDDDDDHWVFMDDSQLVRRKNSRFSAQARAEPPGRYTVHKWPVVLALDQSSFDHDGAPLNRMLTLLVPGVVDPRTSKNVLISLRFVLLRGHPEHSRGCHHGKLWLAATDAGLRVSIGSQNALPGEFMHGNVAWFRDSPWASAGAKPEPFAVDLAEYLSRTTSLLDPVATLVRKADFTGVQARLVYSIPGKAVTSPDRDVGGMWMLARQLKALRASAPVAPHRYARRPFAFMQSGSVGGVLNRHWMQNQLFRAFFGNTEAGRASAAALAAQLTGGAPPPEDATTPRLALGFPSIQQYASLALDPSFVQYALSFLHIDARTAGALQSSVLHTPLTDDCPLFHAKVIVISDAASSTHFTYVGSHNLSQSAWGSQSKAAHGTCNVNNNEVGVVVGATNAFGGAEGDDLETTQLPYILTPYKAGDQPLCRELIASTAPHLLGAQARRHKR